MSKQNRKKASKRLCIISSSTEKLLNVYYLIIPIMTTGVEGVEAIINAIESVVFALCALLLLLATMTASKKLLDAFIVCTKARILYYCLRGVYCLIKRGREAGMFALEFLPTRLGERLAAVKFEQKKAGFSAQDYLKLEVVFAVFTIIVDFFVLHRLQVFSNRMWSTL
ncbi:uncharacterized protein [Dermacentor albipictus]|uniref:uncharacterized protein isoform X5 n=1 Tax=Dermacentor albipictus TaxID=60249 RepID=UPI0038FCEAAB